MLTINPVRIQQNNSLKSNKNQSFRNCSEFSLVDVERKIVKDAVHDLVYKIADSQCLKSLSVINEVEGMFNQLARVGDKMEVIAGMAKVELGEMRAFYSKSVSHGTGFHK